MANWGTLRRWCLLGEVMTGSSHGRKSGRSRRRRRAFIATSLALVVGFVAATVVVLIVTSGFGSSIFALVGAIVFNTSLLLWFRAWDSESDEDRN